MVTTTKKGGLNVVATAELIKHIPLDDLLPNPYQPESRIEVNPETAKKFAYSIQEHGLIQTPVVRPGKEDGKYEIGDGWLRRAGFLFNYKEFGLQDYAKMPCLVKDLTDRQMADMVMEANTVRQDLNPIELAKLYKRYLEDFKIPQVELARRHNCSQGEIANTIRLLELPADIQAKIISQEISETHGRQLLRLSYSPDLQKKVLEESVDKGYSVNQLSNKVADTIYYESKPLDPDDYPRPQFDTTSCEGCQYRQKIGSPYSSEKKTWRCLDKVCYQKRADQAEKDRAAQLQTEIAAAKKVAGDKKKEAGVLDLSKLTWRDYQELDSSIHKIDKTECKNCPRRALGKNWNGRTEMVCINVQCFKAKEKIAQDKEAAKAREAERQLTERVKAACDNLTEESTAFKLLINYLLGHCRKDTREKFGRMYGVKVDDCQQLFMTANEPRVITRTSALVLTLERYEGEKGVFQKMLADLEGTSAELDKALDAHRAKHCRGCVNDNDNRNCRHLIRRYGQRWNDKCYHKSLKQEDEVALEERADARDRELDTMEETAQAEEEAKTETIEVDTLNFKKLFNTNSCEQIMEGKSVKAPYYYRGKYYLCTGSMSGGKDPAEAECYEVMARANFVGELRTYTIPKGREYEEYYESLRNDPDGFYNGMVVKYGKTEGVLVGPPVTFIDTLDNFTPPASVRKAIDVPDAECKDCNLDTEDHTLGHKFLTGNVSHKVCIKDWRAREKADTKLKKKALVA